MNKQQRKENKLKRRKRRVARRFPSEAWLPEDIRGMKIQMSYREASKAVKENLNNVGD